MSAREIERATIRTWPAAVTETRHGWSCLAAGGVTGRVNACWPLDWNGDDADAAIDDVERWYAARGLPPRFKLTDGAFAPPQLPDLLAQRGYQRTTPTLIMVAPLQGFSRDAEVSLSAEMPAAFDAVLRATVKDEAEYDERRNIALRPPAPAAYAMLARNGAVDAIGMTAATGDLAGVFLMRTAPHARRQGFARRILRTLLADAAARGVSTAFLQVEADNASAIALYESEGFARLSEYAFWRKPTP